MATTALVAGALASKAGKGGEAWVRLSYVLGLRRLGWDVRFVEEVERASTAERAYFAAVVERFLGGAAALVDRDGDVLYGDPPGAADVLVNVSGNLRNERLVRRCRRRAYVDIDPGFTQFWHASGHLRLANHHRYFTIGENIGSPGCSIPSGGIPWLPTRPPVVLDLWPAADGVEPGRFTTVASWRGPFGPVEHGGRTFGLKVHEFRKVVELPERSRQTFELALDIHPADASDLEALRRHGWRLVDPVEAAGDPDAFRRYVQGSGAEFSVAQGIYVETDSGWFSDRTARYLASGKPALVQETGFSRNLPVGEGLVSFRTLEEAVAGAESIASGYERHSRAARRLAEEELESGRVLTRLLEETL